MKELSQTNDRSLEIFNTDIDDEKVSEILACLESDEIDPEIEKLEKELLDEVPLVIEPEKKKKKNYLNNKDLLAEVLESKKNGQMTNNLAVMLQTLCKRYAKKGQFASYSYNDDMQSYAMLMLVKTWHAFNVERGKNPFAFFTTCVTNSFKQYLNTEKKQANIKNETLISMGLSPSFNYLTEYEEERRSSKPEDNFDYEPKFKNQSNELVEE